MPKRPDGPFFIEADAPAGSARIGRSLLDTPAPGPWAETWDPVSRTWTPGAPWASGLSDTRAATAEELAAVGLDVDVSD